MAHVAKYTRGAVGHLFKHFERAKDEKGDYIKFSNQDIDTSKSNLNYNLAPYHNQLKYVHERIGEVQCLKRKDVNVICSWVITIPKELPEKYQEDFFKLCYEFLKNRYDPQEKNVISSYVHLDEISPHLHYAFIPVVFDEKKKKEKVSAKELITKKDLQTFHTDLQKFIEKKLLKPHEYTFECNILNGATENGNLTIQGLKAKTLEEQNKNELERMQELLSQSNKKAKEFQKIEQEYQNTFQELEKTLKTLQNDVKMLSVDKSTMLVEKNALKGKINALKGKLLSLEEVNKINVKKTITGGIKGISYEDIINLKATAQKVNEISKMMNESQEKLKQAEQAEKRAEKLLNEAQKMPMKQQIEHIQLIKENESLKRKIKEINEILDELPDLNNQIQQKTQKNKQFDYDMSR